MIKEGYNSVVRNWPALLQYLAILLPFHIANIVVGELLIGDAATASPGLTSLYQFLSDIAVAAGYALAQSVVFARMGADIDRPYWKYDGAWDAIRRFFVFWLILNLAVMSLRTVLMAVAAEAGESSQMMALITWIMIAGATIPFGACVMFYGRVAKQEINEALDTMFAQLPRLMSVLLMAYGAAFFIQMILMGPALPVWQYPLLTVIEGYVTCMVFACTWLICMVHRDEEPEDHDFDF